MPRILIKLALIVLLGTPTLLFAQQSKNVKLDSSGLATLGSLISSWESNNDVLEKAALAKEIQNLLGLDADGLIGRKTIAAIQKTGVSASLTQPSRAENNITRLSLQVSEGKITQEKIDKIIDRTKKGGAEIVKYLEKGSAFYAPAASGVEMAESYLKDQKKQLPCAVYLDGQYGAKDIYAGVPVIIGKNGVEKVVEIQLSQKEKEDFDNSIKSVQELFDAAKKIDSAL